MELRAAHEHPRLPKEGIIFTSVEPFDVALALTAALIPFWPTLDAMQLDGFLRLQYCPVEITFTQFLAVLIANGVKGNNLGVIILVARFFFQRSVDISEFAVIISIVTGIKSLPPPRAGIIFRGGATCSQSHYRHCRKQYVYEVSYSFIQR